MRRGLSQRLDGARISVRRRYLSTIAVAHRVAILAHPRADEFVNFRDQEDQKRDVGPPETGPEMRTLRVYFENIMGNETSAVNRQRALWPQNGTKITP